MTEDELIRELQRVSHELANAMSGPEPDKIILRTVEGDLRRLIDSLRTEGVYED